MNGNLKLLLETIASDFGAEAYITPADARELLAAMEAVKDAAHYRHAIECAIADLEKHSIDDKTRIYCGLTRLHFALAACDQSTEAAAIAAKGKP